MARLVALAARVGLISLPCLVWPLSACGDDAVATSDVGDTAIGDGTSPPDGAGTTTPLPSWDDPAWTEPAAPTTAAVEAHVAAIRTAADAQLDADDRAALAAAVADASPEVVAQGYLSGLYVDAARVLLADATETGTTAVPWIGLAAIELVDGGNAARAADLSRHALALLDGVEPTRLTITRLRASAWNNLGLALRRQGETAGAVHAYRQATALFPDDAHYAVGLVAALDAADLTMPALLEATRATALEVLDDASLAEDATRSTPARAWTARLSGKLEGGIALPPNAAGAEAKADGPSSSFPAVGTSWLGLQVISSDPTGFVVSSPPFMAHGVGHLGAPPACERVSDTYLQLSCPDSFTGGWFEIGALGPHVETRVNEPGLDCSNVMARTFNPEPRTVHVEPGAATLQSQVTALSAAVFREFYAMEGSFAVPLGNADTIVRCSDFNSVAGQFESNLERVDEGCNCSCTDDASCPACWEDYLSACESLFSAGSALANRELARAFTDDVPHQTNIARWMPMIVAMTPYKLGRTACDADCASLIMLDQGLVWPAWVGGRAARFLARAPTIPAREYLRCVARAPAQCGGPADDISSPSEVACLCLGAGLFSACIQGDGSLEVKAAAVLAIGAQVNLREGLSSLRLGVGADVGVNLGPVAFGVSQMTWWDASTNTWKEGGVSFDAGIAGPSGTGIKGAPGVCAGWQADAPEVASATEGMAIEATAGGPP